MNTIIVVDARARGLSVFTASATHVSPGDGAQALVLRKATEIGGLLDLDGLHLDVPILIMGEYQARNSAGFVRVVGEAHHHQTVYVVGGLGFGRDIYQDGQQVRRGDALRPFGQLIKAVLLPAGTKVEWVKTHSNSSVATAAAAMVGLEFMARNTRQVILAHGQSDWIAGIRFIKPENFGRVEFPEEYRSEIFSPQHLLRVAIRAKVRIAVEDMSDGVHLGDAKRLKSMEKKCLSILRDRQAGADVEAPWAEMPELEWLLGGSFAAAIEANLRMEDFPLKENPESVTGEEPEMAPPTKKLPRLKPVE